MSHFRAALREDIFADPALYSQIKQMLRANRVCVIRDAFREDLAEEAWRALDSLPQWKTNYRDLNPFYQLAVRSLPDDVKRGSEMRDYERLFGAPETRDLIEDLSGLCCRGTLRFDASLYLPGDHLTPHTDGEDGSGVAFMWHLAKDWKPNWGGHFFWCSPPADVAPTFNTLILFRVSGAGYHLVTPVSHHARSKRLSLHGWWTPSGELLSRDESRPAAGADDRWSFGPVKQLGSRVFWLG
jgi:Rps23 Pro-64 3,4-dihydroxylase Tpa1-like proline 4-hydroxylase